MTVDDYLAEKCRREKIAALVDYRQGVSFALFVIDVIDLFTSKSNAGWPTSS